MVQILNVNCTSGENITVFCEQDSDFCINKYIEGYTYKKLDLYSPGELYDSEYNSKQKRYSLFRPAIIIFFALVVSTALFYVYLLVQATKREEDTLFRRCLVCCRCNQAIALN
jgi:hypothetical protein